MMKIYTKRGDYGQTGLRGGMRVDKDDVRVEANGEIDELNCVLGMVCAVLPHDDARRGHIARVQQQLMSLMSVVATPQGVEDPRGDRLAELTVWMESEIDRLIGERKFRFVLPGGSLLQAYLHMARSKARTAERRLWTVNRQHEQDERVMCFMNRLSDYLFALATEEETHLPSTAE